MSTNNNVLVCCYSSNCEGECSQLGTAVEALGTTWKANPCCWYLETALPALEIRARLSPFMKDGASLVVVDATNNEVAWKNISPAAAEQIREKWNSRAFAPPSPRVAPKAPPTRGGPDRS